MLKLFNTVNYFNKCTVYFSYPKSWVMWAIIDLHDYLMFFIINIFLVVFIYMFLILFSQQKFFLNINFINNYVNFNVKDYNDEPLLEFFWTIFPALLLTVMSWPSFTLLYAMEQLIDPFHTVIITGNQWYWTYQYSDFDVVSDIIIQLDSIKGLNYFWKIMQKELNFVVMSDEIKFNIPWKGDRFSSYDYFLHPRFIDRCVKDINNSWDLIQFVGKFARKYENTQLIYDCMIINNDNLRVAYPYLNTTAKCDFDSYFFNELFAYNSKLNTLYVKYDRSTRNVMYDKETLNFKVDVLDFITYIFSNSGNIVKKKGFSMNTNAVIDYSAGVSRENKDINKYLCSHLKRKFFHFILHDQRGIKKLFAAEHLINEMMRRYKFPSYDYSLYPHFIDRYVKDINNSLILKNKFNYWDLIQFVGKFARKYENTQLIYDCMIITDDNLPVGYPRLLCTDQVLVLPANVSIRLLITSNDVIHSWALPSHGIKMDAIPGRINQVPFLTPFWGTYWGQCSELCGINHGFMPIEVRVVCLEDYLSFIKLNISYKYDKFCPLIRNLIASYIVSLAEENSISKNS